MAIASLVLGIIALVLTLIVPGMGWIGVLIGIVGIILAAIAKKQGVKSGAATAGLVLSIIAVALSLILWIACAICVSAANSALSGLM